VELDGCSFFLAVLFVVYIQVSGPKLISSPLPDTCGVEILKNVFTGGELDLSLACYDLFVVP